MKQENKSLLKNICTRSVFIRLTTNLCFQRLKSNTLEHTTESMHLSCHAYSLCIFASPLTLPIAIICTTIENIDLNLPIWHFLQKLPLSYAICLAI